MPDKKGFTILEILVVLIIIGIMVAVAYPSLFSYFEQTRVQAARNNLLGIATAQQKFSEDYSGPYCISTGANPSGLTPVCGDSNTDLTTNLHLGFSSNEAFQYSCSALQAGVDPPGTAYRCTAIDAAVTLTLLANATGNCISCAGAQCPFTTTC